MRPLLIAHRGDHINFLENTLEAFQSALDKGADGVELDIRFHEGELIVVHDYYFDKSKSFPLLSDVLEKFGNKGRLEIEVKALDLGFADRLKQLTQSHQDADIEITTSNFVLLSPLRELFPKISLGINFPLNYFNQWMKEDFILEAVLGTMKVAKANVAHVPVIFKELVEEVHKNGFKFHQHIPLQDSHEELKQYQRVLDWEVEQCTFDDIKLLDLIKKI